MPGNRAPCALAKAARGPLLKQEDSVALHRGGLIAIGPLVIYTDEGVEQGVVPSICLHQKH